MYTGGVHFIKRHPALVVACALALACVGIWTAVFAFEGKRSGLVTLSVLNVGQGDALFVQGPTGIQVLIDAGANTGAVLRELAKVMPWWDRTIDAAIETHPDADHVGGFLDVFERYRVGVFMTPGILKRNTITGALEKAVDAERSLVYVARRGMVIDMGGGASLEVLYPDTDVAGWGGRSNDGSIVARLVYGNTSALLMGDAPAGTEQRLLLRATSTLVSDVLKVGHHGSHTSSGEAFVRAVSPQVALISVGANNRYGHPAPEVVERLNRVGARLLRTDQGGAIACASDALAFTCKQKP